MAALEKPLAMNTVAGKLGVSTTNLSLQTLCQHTGVNGYSKYKPIAHSSGAPLTDAEWAAADYGLGVPRSLTLPELCAYISRGTTPTGWSYPANTRALKNGWYYKYPTANFRLSDFWGYNHEGVKELINFSAPEGVNISSTGTNEVVFSMYYQQSATMADIFALNSPTMQSYRYFGVAAVLSSATAFDTAQRCRYIVTSTAGQWGTITLDKTNISRLFNSTSGTYKLIPFLTTHSGYSNLTASSSTKITMDACLPLPCNPMTCTVSSQSQIVYGIGISNIRYTFRSTTFSVVYQNIANGEVCRAYLTTDPSNYSTNYKAYGSFTAPTASVSINHTPISLGAGETLYLKVVYVYGGALRAETPFYALAGADV